MKHAFMIIAHNQFEILESQIQILDSYNNDFYVHIDKKVKKDLSYLKNLTKKSRVYFVDSINVQWGKYSQIECELILLEAAAPKHYDYYHLLSGVDMPIKTIAQIDSFFEQNAGKEFIHFDSPNVTSLVRDRIAKYNICPGRKQWQKQFNGLFVKIQNLFGCDRLKNLTWKVMKGANWFSITDSLVQDIVANSRLLRKVFKYSFCGDEVFIQTYVYNSRFKDKLYYCNYDDNYDACMRYIDWKRGNPYVFCLSDFNDLLNCKYMFARKFDYVKCPGIVEKLKNVLTGEGLGRVTDEKDISCC